MDVCIVWVCAGGVEVDVYIATGCRGGCVHSHGCVLGVPMCFGANQT